ncbi:MAG: hypothetical protein HC888_09045 [Candidatus Competibacteraceae bacterium]|nr:hypothetical protein [Candidatus Competibacteraceae bacterium]
MQSIFSSGQPLHFPDDIIVLSDGRILVSDLGNGNGNGRIIEINPSDGSKEIIGYNGFLDSPNSLTESSDGSLIVADGEQRGIIRIDLDASPDHAQTLISDGGLFVNPKGATVIYRQINGSRPTDILLSNHTFDEHQPSGTFIGTLSSVDPDANDQFTYEITGGAYGFSLSGNSLVTYKEFDYESEGPTLSVTIETTDSEGLRFEKVFTVSIQNITSDDDDEDGLTECEEITLGTNTLDADSDDDGAIDGLEVEKATDPTDGNDAPDWYLATFGLNESGEQYVPESVTTPWKLAAGHGFTIALLADGTVTGWGRNDSGQTDIPVGLNSVVDISAFGYHVLALKADGTVVAGSNTESQTDVPPELDNVVAIAAGAYHSLALKSDGTVVSWGHNNNNQGHDSGRAQSCRRHRCGR